MGVDSWRKGRCVRSWSAETPVEARRVDDRGRELPPVPARDVFKQLWGEENVPGSFRRAPFAALIGLVFMGMLFAFVGLPGTTGLGLIGAAPLSTLSFFVALLGGSIAMAWTKGGARFREFGDPRVRKYAAWVPVAFGGWLIASTQFRAGLPWSTAVWVLVMVAGYFGLAFASQRLRASAHPGGQGRRARWLLAIAQLVMPMAFLYFLHLTLGWLAGWADWQVLALGAGVGVVLAIWARWREAAERDRQKLSPKPEAGPPMLVAWLAANGHCGACGYSMEDSPVQSDGVRLCPECGAAWHADRVTRPRPPIESAKLLYFTLSRTTEDGLLVDHRGVALTRRARTLWAWLKDAVPEGAGRLQAWCRALGRARLRLILPWAVVGWVGVGGFLVFTVPAVKAHEIWVLAGLIVVVGIGIGAWVYMYAAMGMRPHELLNVILCDGLCPQCARPLVPGEQAEFDGCVSCQHCGHAWKRDRIGAPFPPAK